MDRQGSGPALRLARAGYAALSVDGPLGGLRNPDAQDEQFLIFNILNPTALRDKPATVGDRDRATTLSR